MGVASLVLGIISIVFCFIPGISVIGIVTGIIAIILGVMGGKDEAEKGKAKAGLVMGIIGLSLSVIIWVSCVICVNKVQTDLEKAGISLEKGLKELEKAANDPEFKKAAEGLKKLGEKMAESTN